jgi:hypothetical protein
MPGLDPGIYTAAQQDNSYKLIFWIVIMDCRVKPGNDEREAFAGQRCCAV